MNMNSELLRRSLSGVAQVATLCAALLGAACTDSNKSVQQPSEVQTTQQAAAATDLTATETVNNGIRSYTATLPPVAVVGTITQRLEATWDPSIHTLKDAPVFPQYWNIEYYAGSTRLAATPATLSEWATVTRVVTSGNIQVEALDGDRQAIVSTLPAPPVQVASNFSSVSLGDGWDVFFDAAYTRIYNIHHHGEGTAARPATMMCRNLVDSSTCPGFPISLTQTSHRSTGRIDTTSNKLWQPTVTADNRLAWDCVNLTTAARCATPVVVTPYTGRGPLEGAFYNNHVDPVVIGRKMYAIGFASGNVTRITCLDMATGTECQGIALPQNGTFYHSGLEAVGTRLYVLPGANLNLDCYESTTMQRCEGSWPKQVADSPVWGVRSADGAIRNICANTQCFSLDGSAHTLPPNFTAYLATHPVQGLKQDYIQVGSGTSVGTKAAWSTTNERSVCWDMTTDALCAPAFPIAVPRLYTSTLDPQDPECLWTNGDDGIIRNFRTTTGAPGCGGGVPRLSFRAQISIPRLGCDPASRVYLFKSFKLIAPDPSKYTSARLTVKDSEGTPIPGWVNVPIPANATVDLAGLTTAIAGVTPTFDVATTGFTDTTVVPTSEFRVTTGSAPQLCWDLSGPALVCPTQPGLALSPAPTPQATAVTAKGSYTPTSGTTTSFTDQVLNTNVNTNPPTFENCNGTRLRATVTSVADGKPVAGAVVFLLDSAGNPVLNASGQPVSAVSAADGTVEFPVWAAGYTLKMSGTTSYSPVYANVTAGGSGTTLPTGGTVVSSTVTTTANQVSHVAIAVNVPQTPVDPVDPVDPEPCTPVEPAPPQDRAWFQGSGCASAGGTQPALMMLMALGGLMVLRRRRA
jgi:MYXO-CTERM domain-containing protein